MLMTFFDVVEFRMRWALSYLTIPLPPSQKWAKLQSKYRLFWAGAVLGEHPTSTLHYPGGTTKGLGAADKWMIVILQGWYLIYLN